VSSRTRDPRGATGLGWLWLGISLAYLLTAGGTLATGDATSTLAVAEAMVDRGQVDVAAGQSDEAWRGVDGRYYLPFGIGQSLYDVPFVVLARLAARTLGGPAARQEPLVKAWVALASTGSASLCAVAVAGLAWRFGRDRRAALVAGWLAAFATPLWPYSKFGFSAPLVGAALAAGVLGLAAGAEDDRPAWVLAGGAMFGAALLVRYEAALAAAAAVAWLLAYPGSARKRCSRVAIASVGPLAAAGIAMAYNLARYGGPLRTGHTPDIAWRGAWGLLASPSASVVVFAPIVVAAAPAVVSAWRRRVPAAGLVAVVVTTMALFYASLDDYLGTRSYGPRYLVPLIPLLVAAVPAWVASSPWCGPAGPRSDATRRRRLVAVIAVISLLVQVPAVLLDFSRVGIAAGRPARVTSWTWSPLVLVSRAAVRAVPENVRYVSGLEPRPRVEQRLGDAGTASALSFSLDFWWLYAWYLGLVSRARALAAAAILAIGSGVCLAAAWRSTREEPDVEAVGA
jgi:hypothetical protein